MNNISVSNNGFYKQIISAPIPMPIYDKITMLLYPQQQL